MWHVSRFTVYTKGQHRPAPKEPCRSRERLTAVARPALWMLESVVSAIRVAKLYKRLSYKTH